MFICPCESVFPVVVSEITDDNASRHVRVQHNIILSCSLYIIIIIIIYFVTRRLDVRNDF